MKPALLIIDDEKTILNSLDAFFQDRYDVHLAENGKEGLARLATIIPAAVILDLKMPDMDGIQVLEKIKAADSDIPVIMLTAFGNIDTAVQAMKLGAEQFLTKPVDLHALESVIEKSIMGSRLQRNYRVENEKFQREKERLILDAETKRAITLLRTNPDATVLITGPTGSGKGAITELIHRESARSNAPFVKINCAGLSVELLESELFGHERGAFTGATVTKKGLMEIADGGTLFMDEIGETPMTVQAKILSAIEDKAFRRVGGTSTIKVDTRIIAATNADLGSKIQKGEFRSDLYYRLNIVPIRLHPLCDRGNDILDLIMLFLREFSGKMNAHIDGLTDETISILKSYSWPGNIRELRNIIERAVMTCEDNLISPKNLPQEMHRRTVPAGDAHVSELISLEEAEKQLISMALKKTGNHKEEAARILGIHVSTLWRKIKKYEI